MQLLNGQPLRYKNDGKNNISGGFVFYHNKFANACKNVILDLKKLKQKLNEIQDI